MWGTCNDILVDGYCGLVLTKIIISAIDRVIYDYIHEAPIILPATFAVTK